MSFKIGISKFSILEILNFHPCMGNTRFLPVLSTDIWSCSLNGKKYVFYQFQEKNSQFKEQKKCHFVENFKP